MTCATCRLARLCTQRVAAACIPFAPMAGFETPKGTTLQIVGRARFAAKRAGDADAVEALWREYRRIAQPPPPPPQPGAALAAAWRPLPAQADLFVDEPF
jgi:hypothetical protein